MPSFSPISTTINISLQYKARDKKRGGDRIPGPLDHVHYASAMQRSEIHVESTCKCSLLTPMFVTGIGHFCCRKST